MARSSPEQKDANRSALIRAGRAVFLKDGFERATNDEIARRAGLTRGALHHQFGDKRGLFEAVFAAEVEKLGRRLYGAVMARAEHGLDEVESGAEAIIDAFLERGARIILLDLGPAALGQARWRAMLDPATLALIEHALGHWAEAGLVGAAEVRPLAVAFLGAALASIRAIAEADDPAGSRQLAVGLLHDLAAGLRDRRARARPGGGRC